MLSRDAAIVVRIGRVFHLLIAPRSTSDNSNRVCSQSSMDAIDAFLSPTLHLHLSWTCQYPSRLRETGGGIFTAVHL